MLGSSEYGAFASALALAALAIPFSSIGTNTLMLKNVARRAESASAEWRRALAYTLGGGITLSLLLFTVSELVLPSEVTRLAFLQITLAELVGLKLVELVGLLWQSLGKSVALIVLPNVLNLLRLAAALAVFLLWGSAPLELWASIYMWSTLPLGVVVAVHTTIKLGRSRFSIVVGRKELREGLLYSVSMASQNVHNDIDKAMLARIDSAASAGVYSAAYRVIDMAYAPIRSVATAAYPLYFKEGELGLGGALRLTKKIAPIVVIIGLLAGSMAALLAPLAPVVLGQDYVDAVDVVRLLAPLVLLRGITFLAADTLTGCGRQGYRTLTQIAVAVVNVILNILLIPSIGIMGAVISTLACETLLALLLWLRIWFARQEKGPSRELQVTIDESPLSAKIRE